MTDAIQIAKDKESDAIQRERLSDSLSHYSRKIAFEKRSRRNLYRLAGLAPRRRDHFFSILIWGTGFLALIIPFLVSLLYYTLIVSPQFESETRFVLRSAAPFLTSDRFKTVSVEPKQKIIQDTQVVISYLTSISFIEDITSNLDLDEKFSRDDIDFLSRLAPSSTKEDLQKYWNKMHDSWISPKSGIVTLRVRAFTPIEAQQILEATLKLSEERVNRLNSGIWNSLEISSESDLNFASEKLEIARTNLREQQVKSGVLNVERSAEKLTEIISSIEVELAKQKIERNVLLASLSKEARAVVELDHRIAARERELQKFRQRETAQQSKLENSLASISGDFQKLELQLEIAEKRFSNAVAEFEKVKLLKSLQLIYLDQFTAPTLPEDSTYPNPFLAILYSLLTFTIIFGILIGLVLVVRQKID